MKFYDVSVHNSKRYPDLRRLEDADFFMIRAGIGVSVDSFAARYVEQCKGFRPWYPYWAVSPYWESQPQVIKCVETCASLGSICTPMPLVCADLEIVKLSGVAYKPARINKVWKEFCQKIPGMVSIYTAAWVMSYLKGEDIRWMKAHPLHVASYRAGAPYMTGLPWSTWTAWQYTSSPIDTNLGADAFYGPMLGDPPLDITVLRSAAVELLAALPGPLSQLSAEAWNAALTEALLQ